MMKNDEKEELHKNALMFYAIFIFLEANSSFSSFQIFGLQKISNNNNFIAKSSKFRINLI